jgi:hypothetical protein
VLDDAAAAGITVLRLWAFADGPQWNALQVNGHITDSKRETERMNEDARLLIAPDQLCAASKGIG